MRNHPVHPVLWPTSHREQPTELIVPGLLKKLVFTTIENNIRSIQEDNSKNETSVIRGSDLVNQVVQDLQDCLVFVTIGN